MHNFFLLSTKYSDDNQDFLALKQCLPYTPLHEVFYIRMPVTELSIIIPAYNEAAKIAKDMAAVDAFLSAQMPGSEIIVVDDGSTDATLEAARQTAAHLATPCLIEHIDHKGKGSAVRTGVLKSSGKYVLFADSGGCVPFSDAVTGIELIRTGACQIAHGSRKLSHGKIHRHQSRFRQLCSSGFHWFLIQDIKRIGNLTDTQCGFKVYQGDVARQLYAKSRIDGFMFDIELVLLALSQGYTIREFAVHWTCDPDSRLKPLRQSPHILADTIRLKHRFKNFLKAKTV